MFTKLSSLLGTIFKYLCPVQMFGSGMKNIQVEQNICRSRPVREHFLLSLLVEQIQGHPKSIFFESLQCPNLLSLLQRTQSKYFGWQSFLYCITYTRIVSCRKVGCVFPMVIVLILLNAEFGRSDRR